MILIAFISYHHHVQAAECRLRVEYKGAPVWFNVV
jgi:hypothetical protein